ncbi:unnamed protein product [Vitrella brassicaformis CCMP3155]|uniref:Uncharacterized protein n=1 Tax=Vitrella brassicaformis (strain CCMP3155) TaxID=1169540 RepID=A0A0G4FSI8_VITBC|nr:unnamed protein product [Vitrella brassicaformis CCMP3155]|eukprot:CEM17666.1 unnamed protein product [Vitrella brassicaformis CCMP3155]
MQLQDSAGRLDTYRAFHRLQNQLEAFQVDEWLPIWQDADEETENWMFVSETIRNLKREGLQRVMQHLGIVMNITNDTMMTHIFALHLWRKRRATEMIDHLKEEAVPEEARRLVRDMPKPELFVLC